VKEQNFHIESIKIQNVDHRNIILETADFPLSKALRFMISSSLLLSLNGVMVVVFGFFLASTRIMPPLILAAFLVTFSVYGLNKVTDKAEDLVNRPETSPIASGYYLIFSVASMLIGFLIGIFEGLLAFFALFAPVIIGVIYSVRISKSIPRLKEIVGVKSLVVAACWGLTGCLLPDSFGTAKLPVIVIVFVYIFIRVFVGATLCDVLDKKGDLVSGVETIPIRLGRNKTKKLLLFLNSLGMLLSIYCVATGILVRFVPALLFGVLYGYLAIWFFFRDNCKRFAAGLMLDGEWLPIVIIVCLLIRY
jgi:4-hydroxybenzoate polyprenyltransferase